MKDQSLLPAWPLSQISINNEESTLVLVLFINDMIGLILVPEFLHIPPNEIKARIMAWIWCMAWIYIWCVFNICKQSMLSLLVYMTICTPFERTLSIVWFTCLDTFKHLCLVLNVIKVFRTKKKRYWIIMLFFQTNIPNSLEHLVQKSYGLMVPVYYSLKLWKSRLVLK